MRTRLGVPILLLGVAACATPGQVKRVETQVAVMQREQARADSARAAQLTELLQTMTEAYDSLSALNRSLDSRIAQVSRDNQAQYDDLNRQQVQIRELLASSQGKISELRTQIESSRAPTMTGDSTVAGGAAQVPLTAGAILDNANNQNRTGSRAAARLGYRQILSQYPDSPEASEAMYGLADTFAGDGETDSARVYWTQLVKKWPQAAKAPTSLYKLGQDALTRGNRVAAKDYFKQVLDKFPQSIEATLAKQLYDSIQY